MSEDEKDEGISNARAYLIGEGYYEKKRLERERKQKEKEEKEFKKQIEESARKNINILETVSTEKWQEFLEEHVIPTKKLLKYFKNRLGEISISHSNFANYIYHIYEENLQKRLLEMFSEEFHKVLDPKIKQFEEETQGLVQLYYNLEELFESLILLLATKLDKKAEVEKILEENED